MRQLSFLVVEDHEFQRNMLVKILKGMQAEAVYAAPDGRTALDLLRSLGTGVDVIISDLDMPGMDGMEFIRHIGLKWQGTALVIASALERGLLSSVETMGTAYAVRVLGTIEKPVTSIKIEQILRRYAQTFSHTPATPRGNRLSFTADEIAEGIENDEFEPFFQPKIEIATSTVVGAEALARWRHPQQGLIAPGAFVSELEQSGKIDMLMRCVLRKATEIGRRLRSAKHDQSICVNISLKSLHDVTLADQITEIVRSHGGDPARMVLEITESAATTDVGAALENLARLRIKGFGLSIDDYGTGYSSLEQLTRIPFTELKIDQAFVTHAGRRESAKVILASSLEMARKLKLIAIAEGVETQENWDMLHELGCDIAQGYYIAKPMSGDDYLAWTRDWSRMRGK